MAKKWTCMYDDCNNGSINSHILQKNGILRHISENNHLIQLSTDLNYGNESPFKLKKIGINEAYSFPGFCSYHDNSLFKQIESKTIINFNDKNNSLLFSYRKICDEIRRKEIIRDIQNEFNNYLDFDNQLNLISFINGLNEGIENLKFFKRELENNLNQISDSFDCYTFSFKEIKICVSGALSIEQKYNLGEKVNDIYSPGKIPFVTSIINIFPYNHSQQVVISIHKEYRCNWTLELINQLQSSNYLKVLSDLLVTRTEVWCASPIIINSISKNTIEKYREVWQRNIFNFSNTINVDFNLFGD